MTFTVNPITDPRWGVLLQRSPRASIFHTPGWLEALSRTYGYQPSVVTTTEPHRDLTNGIALCYVRSWLTGDRLVSLPFSDHCEPLSETTDDVRLLVDEVKSYAKQTNCHYLELRPVGEILPECSLQRSARYWLHRLNLRPGVSAIFDNFHHDCVKRKIRRAEREGLVITQGRTPDILRKFYVLASRTRRRHGLPPQPFTWFTNLASCLDTAFTVYVASKNNRPIAGIVTLEHKTSLVYKYGASDERFHNLGGMPYLFWSAIQGAVSRGLTELDLGRSDLDGAGLLAFKDHLGAVRYPLSYWRFQRAWQETTSRNYHPLMKRAVGYIPRPFLNALGSLFYRHVG